MSFDIGKKMREQMKNEHLMYNSTIYNFSFCSEISSHVISSRNISLGTLS